MNREDLPMRRAAETFDIEFSGVKVTVSFGYYDDGRPGEVFVASTKTGTAVDTMARDSAVLVSLALQYGVTPQVLERALMADAHGRPEGFAGKIAHILTGETVHAS